jgi:hypothetical protein
VKNRCPKGLLYCHHSMGEATLERGRGELYSQPLMLTISISLVLLSIVGHTEPRFCVVASSRLGAPQVEPSGRADCSGARTAVLASSPSARLRLGIPKRKRSFKTEILTEDSVDAHTTFGCCAEASFRNRREPALVEILHIDLNHAAAPRWSQVAFKMLEAKGQVGRSMPLGRNDGRFYVASRADWECR